MKKINWIPVIGTLVLIAGLVSYCPAAEKVAPPLSTSSGQAGAKANVQVKPDSNRPFELREEFINRILADIKEKDPNKAKELEALRDKDPAKFRDQMRGIMRERFEAMSGEGMDRGFGPGGMAGEQGGPGGMAGGPGGQGGPGGMEGRPGRPEEQGPGFRPFQEEREEFIKWVKDSYPDEAKKLEELKGDQDLYERQLRLLGRKYGWIYRQIKENPKLGEVLKEDMELVRERDNILRQINEAKSEADKAKLTADLEKVLSERYDLIIKRTQIEYEQLGKRIEELKKQVEESKANVEKWKSEDYKKNEVKNQVEKLLKGGPRFRWQQ